jgi:hypothetical protein
MLNNTGTISFILYGIFISIAVVAMLFAFYFIKKDTIEASKLDKMIELFKYTIVTTAIATVTLIVTDLFKERDQDVKELNYFDKYVNDVKKVDGVEERIRLTKYLSIVAPSGPMKKSWKCYYDTIAVEYKDYLKLKKIKEVNDTIKNPTQKQLNKINEVDEKIFQYEKPLASVNQSKNNSKNDIIRANEWEQKGFQLLLNKDLDKAIIAFQNSEDNYNGYHQTYEISKYLKFNKSKLEDLNSNNWNNAFVHIAKNLSWKMPLEMKNKLIEKASFNFDK